MIFDAQKKVLFGAAQQRLALLVLLTFAWPEVAAYVYNSPPQGDKQVASCVRFFNKYYEGGTAASPVKGQSKAQAFCTCIWNETPENFKGSLATFAESAKGKTANTICEKHADWVN
jgi:hypothetical protein